MSDLLSGLEPGRARPRRRGSLAGLAVVVPLAIAVIVSAPRIWKTVRTEPSSSIAVASLPAPQPAAGAQLPLEQSPRPARGQLATLGRFVARDPFTSPLPAPAPAAAVASAPVASAPVAADPAAGLAPDAATAGAGLAPETAAPAPAVAVLAPDAAAPTAALPSATATISVNGIPETVSLRALFPAADPLFRLVAFGAGEVQIGVVGGSSPGGEQTVTLVRDRALTLLDTASGGRYELRLVSLP